MKRINSAGLFGALLGFISVTLLLTQDVDVPLLEKPSVALNGLAFAFSFGVGLSSVLAYILVCAVFILAMALGYILFAVISNKICKK